MDSRQSRRAYLCVIGATATLTGCLRLSDDEQAETPQESADQSPSQDPPEAQFSSDYDESAEELSITHTSGDSIDADRVSVEGAAGNGEWETDTISAGDSVTVSVEETDSVAVVWTSQEGSSTELFVVDVPG